jgi:hypothetical protein
MHHSVSRLHIRHWRGDDDLVTPAPAHGIDLSVMARDHFRGPQMRLLLVAVGVAVLAGYAFGGRLQELDRMKLRWWALALIGLLLQIPPPGSLLHSTQLQLALLWASFGCLIAFAARNLSRRGFALILLGLACNFIVIAANRGMPVNASAVRASGQAPLLRDLAHGRAAKHHLERRGDTLLLLADEIPIGWPINQVVSGGDVLVYAGMVWVVADAMQKRPREPARAPR